MKTGPRFWVPSKCFFSSHKWVSRPSCCASWSHFLCWFIDSLAVQDGKALAFGRNLISIFIWAAPKSSVLWSLQCEFSGLWKCVIGPNSGEGSSIYSRFLAVFCLSPVIAFLSCHLSFDLVFCFVFYTVLWSPSHTWRESFQVMSACHTVIIHKFWAVLCGFYLYTSRLGSYDFMSRLL